MGVYLKGKNWFIDYYVGHRRKREKIGPSKDLALKVLKKRQIEVAEGRFMDIRKEQKIKFESFADEYIEKHSKPNNRSWERAEIPYLKHLKLRFAGKYLHEITAREVNCFKVELKSREYSDATVNRIIGLLKSIYNKASAWGIYNGVNPVKGVKFFKERPRLRFLEKEEIARLIENCNEPLKSIVIVAIGTGMRKNELLKLEWSNIDMNRGLINLYYTKNDETRSIPMNQTVRKIILRQKELFNSPYVFPKSDGKSYVEIKRAFVTALKKAGLEDVNFHTLRHTFASHLIMAGIDIRTVQVLMGHKKIEMTLRYSHLSPGHTKQAVDILETRMDTVWTPRSLGENLDISQIFMDNNDTKNTDPGGIKLSI